MSQDFQLVTTEDVNEQLQAVIEDRLRSILAARQPGHCMRVGDLDTAVMLAAARNLRSELGSRAQVHMLAREARSEDSLLITSSKLVELRNPPAEGEQRPPLLVFVPNDLRTAAEDSFAEATFEQISVTDAFIRLRERLLQELPQALQSFVGEALRIVEEREWRWADAVAVVRFLLGIRLNGAESEVVGASLCELGLVPDFHLLDDPVGMSHRLAKNLECVDRLTVSTKSERGRVLDLKLRDPAFRGKFGDFLCETGVEDPVTWTRRIVAEKALWPLSFDKWQFSDGAGFTQQVRLDVIELGLPAIQQDEADSRLQQLIGQQVLLIGRKGPKNFKVKFHCDPAPEIVPGLDHFRLQVVSRESGPTAFTKKKKSWVGARKDASVSFAKLASVDWEDGWHFVRVLPCTAEGDPIPIVDANGAPIPLGGSPDGHQMLNESDAFYVVKSDDVEVDVPPGCPGRC